jgi:hypothetical protein
MPQPCCTPQTRTLDLPTSSSRSLTILLPQFLLLFLSLQDLPNVFGLEFAQRCDFYWFPGEKRVRILNSRALLMDWEWSEDIGEDYGVLLLNLDGAKGYRQFLLLFLSV